jgi:hypothetical protein
MGSDQTAVGGKEYCRNCLEYITDDYWHDSAKEGR